MQKRGLLAGMLFVGLCLARPALGIYLDEDKNFKITATLYAQTRFRLQDSEGPLGQQTQLLSFSGGTPLNTQMGNIVQLRNYAAPVFEGSLLKPLGLRNVLDDLSFRFAGRFVYDGIYDFGPDEFRQALRLYNVSARTPAPDGSVGLGGNQPVPIFFGTRKVEDENHPDKAAVRAARLRDQELFDPRSTYAEQTEPWEIYVNLQKGPVFVRVGRQNLSWGETDGLRLLDLINPVDNFFGLTFDEDLDEKRIPLWMIRANAQLIANLGPLSSFGLETFLVPGVIDVTQGPVLYQGFLHPYAPPTGCDAQLIADNNLADAVQGRSTLPSGCRNAAAPGSISRGRVKTSLYERLPEKKWENSRMGARFVGIFMNEYTFSLAAYTSWADQPAPLVHYNDRVSLKDLDASLGNLLPAELAGLTVPMSPVVELTHSRELVVGGTLSFYQKLIYPGVVRMELGYFFGEPGQVQLANQGDGPSGLVDTFVPQADFLRWVIGFDVFELNIPWLSRTNNLILITQWFNSYRITSNGQYEHLVRTANDAVLRNLPNVLPDRPAPPKVADSFGQFQLVANPGRAGKPILPAVGDRYNATWSVALQAFLMHGNLIPQIVGVAFTEGDFGFLPSFVYRLNDSIQVKVGYAGIFGKFSQLGLFRDRDQVGLRFTYLIS